MLLPWLRRCDASHIRAASTCDVERRQTVKCDAAFSCGVVSVRSPEIKGFTTGHSGDAGRVIRATSRRPAGRSPVATARVRPLSRSLTGFARYNTQLRARQDLLPVRTVDSGDARGPRWGTASFLGVRFPQREMDAATGLGDAGPGPPSKSLSSEIYAQSRGRWRDEARKQRLRGRRRARLLLRPLPGASRYNCGALHLRRR